ncbi:XRE family transcriptional regulator [Brevibacillus sp. FSL K6-2834]|uniref:helix-turn-helix domain-containing protein n=1 Tax=Brevibacillus sp. FSL K6-2834 TaxID=2954680 RepID=UPI003158DA17
MSDVRSKESLVFNPRKLKEARLARGLTILELAEILNVTKQAVSQFELGNAMPKAETMMAIINALELPRMYFYEHDEQEYIGNTFFRKSSTTPKKVLDMQRARANWVYRIYSYLEKYINFPRLNIPNTSIFGNKEWSTETIEELASYVRKKWDLGDKPILNMINVLEKNGIIVAELNIGNEKVDAFCQFRSGRPLVIVGDDKGSAVRRQFDLAHELGHLLMHSWVEDQEQLTKEEYRRIEDEANHFASSFLLPESSFRKTVKTNYTLDDYVELKKYWRVSIAAMIMRAKEVRIISENRYTYLQKLISMKKMRKKEPLDDVLPLSHPTILRKAVRMLLESKIKTEMEIVYDVKISANEIERICQLEPGTLNFKENEPVVELKDIMLRRKHFGS